VKEGFLKEKYL